jgi:homoaconitase/3-isopropylmalate dehydratase large subunit
MSKAAEIEEDNHFPMRDKTKLRRKHMYVNGGVDGRLSDLKKAKKILKSKKMEDLT